MSVDDGAWIAKKSYHEWKKRSQNLLEQIDRLDAEIAAAGEQRELRINLEREKRSLRQEFARHLGELTYVDSLDSRTVIPVWLVTGVPSKRYRAEARVWLARRGLIWNGSAPSLRHEVREALRERKMPVPEHRFGLHIERTIDIKLPRIGTLNLLGKSHQFVAPPCGEMTNAEIKEEKAFRKFVRGEN